MSNEDITEALESIDERYDGLNTLATKALDKEKGIEGHFTCPITPFEGPTAARGRNVNETILNSSVGRSRRCGGPFLLLC